MSLSAAKFADVATVHTTSTAFAALIWWVVPLVLVSGAIGYVPNSEH
jgi:hypothetical protein